MLVPSRNNHYYTVSFYCSTLQDSRSIDDIPIYMRCMETAFRPHSCSRETQDDSSSRKAILSKESPEKSLKKMIEQEHPEAADRASEHSNGIHDRVHVLETKKQEKDGGWEGEDEGGDGGEEEDEEEDEGEEVIMAEEDMLRILDKVGMNVAVAV